MTDITVEGDALEAGSARDLRRPKGQIQSALSPVRRFGSPARVLLGALALVVVLVTLPLLRSLALRSNEMDALRALDLMGREVFAAGSPVSAVGELFGEDRPMSDRLPDTRLLEGGRLMFHHGYLFEIVPTTDGGRALRAWPLSHGETGLGAFTSPGPGQLLGHPNQAARWSGTGAAPPVHPHAGADTAPAAEGWRPMLLSASRGPGM